MKEKIYIVQLRIDYKWIDKWKTDELRLAKKYRDLCKKCGEIARVVEVK